MSGNETRKNLADQDKTIAPRGAASENLAGTSPPANDDPTIMGSQTVAPGDARARAATIGRVNIEGYEIIEELGRGGMGVVYKARDVELNRIVAIKMILAGVHAGEESLARFRTEAEAVAQLKHPGIVQVYDVGQADGQPFCALEYVEGGSLDQRIRDEPMPVRDAVALVESLAHAMQSAHQAGIVHRDLKPPNILLARQTGSSSEAGKSPGWTAKITDFGLAKKVEQESQQTQTGAVMGTPSYMAPEQARGVKRIGPSADVYSLGAILYELITGQPPFSEDTPINTIMRVMADPPPAPRSINPAIDRDLDTICLKCLEKEPAARYVSAEHLAQDLERYLEGMPIEARPVSGIERTVKWVRRKPLAASLIGVSTLGLIGLIVGGAIFNAKLSAAYQQVDLQYDKTIAALEQTRLAKESAEASDAESNRRLVNNYVDNALQAMNKGNMLQALPWLSEAIVSERDDQRRKMHQLRFSYALESSPRPVQTWVAGSHFDGCQFSSDGSLMAAFSVDRRLRIWNIGNGEVVREIESFGPLAWFALSADCKTAITASIAVDIANIGGETQAADIRRWDLSTGNPIGKSIRITSIGRIDYGHFIAAEVGLVMRPYLKPENGDATNQLVLIDLFTADVVTEIALEPGERPTWLAPSGKFCVVSGDKPRIIEVASGDTLYPLAPQQVPDGEYRIGVEREGLPVVIGESIDVISPDTRQSVVSLPRSQENAWPRVAAAPGYAFAVGWPDGILEQFDGEGSLVDTRRVDAGIEDMRYSGDARQLFVATRAGVIQFAAETGSQMGSLIPATIRPLRSIDISPDNRQLAISGGAGILKGSGFVRVWDIASGSNRIPLIPGSTKPLATILPSPDRLRLAATPNRGSKVSVITHETDGRELEVFETGLDGPEASPVSFAAWRSETEICTGFRNGQIRIIDVADQTVVQSLSSPRPEFAVFNDDGSLLAIAGGDDTKFASVIDVASGAVLCEGLEHNRNILWMAFDAESRLLFTLSRDFNIRTFDAHTGEMALRQNASLLPVNGAWCASRQVLCIVGERLGGMPGRVRLLDLTTGKQLFEPLEFNSPVIEAAFDAQGQTLAIADANGLVQLYDATTGESLGIPMVHPDAVNSMRFSPDGLLLMTCCRDLNIRLFDVASSTPVTAPLAHQTETSTAEFLGTGYDVVSSGDGGTVWRVPMHRYTADEAAVLSRYWSGSTMSSRGAVVPVTADTLDAAAVQAALRK